MEHIGNILIVDDNKEILTALKLFLKEHSYRVRICSNPNLIPGILHEESFDLILLDMNFSVGINSGNEGIFWLREILEYDKDSIVIFLTAYGNIDLAVKSLQQGAIDFIQKPWSDEKLLATISSGIKLRRSREELSSLKLKQKHIVSGNKNTKSIIYGSEAMQQVMDTALKVAKTDASVLILGENGTGKDLLAKAIHANSLRSEEIYLSVDMGSLTESLFESELFGYIRGAYTDAKEDKPGRFELAAGGTLFMDEIGNIPLHLQSKLLTVIQSGEVTRLGSNTAIKTDIRLISATNTSPEIMVDQGRFREDLLFRINTIQIIIPPLRERPEDIRILAELFVKEYSKKYNKPKLNICDKALKKLEEYSFPGNIRELEHLVERAVILATNKKIDYAEILPTLQDKNLRIAKSLQLEENELILIQKALRQTNNNYSAACKELGISRKTLYNKMKKYGI